MFVDHFVSEPLKPESQLPSDANYSESRGLTVLRDGSPLIEGTWQGDTLTKIVNEGPKDHAGDPLLDTKTSVDRETPDELEGMSLLATETFVRRENPDHHDLELLLGTETRVAREDPDHTAV
jgi:hypothetical protein